MLRPNIKQIIQEKINSNTCANGWIKNIRKQNRFWFAQINDGSTSESLQVVIPSDLINKNDLLTLGSSIEVVGNLVESSGTVQNIEILAESVRLIGSCPGDSYPIQKFNNSPDFMRSNSLNFRLRSGRDSSIARLKSELFSSQSTFLRNQDFTRIFPPILTEHDCEGGGEVFRVEADRPDFFSKPAYLTVSTQLHLEIAASSLSRVYSFGPVFRAENQHTTKHLSEFWMLECEISFLESLDILLNFIERMLKTSVESLIPSSNNLQLDKDRINDIVYKPFAKISYTEAIEELSKISEKFEYPIFWGKDLQTEHERYLAEEIFGGPVFVTDYPEQLKPFYMKLNEDGKTVKCCDLLVPGIGEIVGGSLREDNYFGLKKRIEQKFNVKNGPNPLQWYLDLRKFGSVPHGGFGLGFDRFLQFISGTRNIRDVVMIPRFAGSIKF